MQCAVVCDVQGFAALREAVAARIAHRCAEAARGARVRVLDAEWCERLRTVDAFVTQERWRGMKQFYEVALLRGDACPNVRAAVADALAKRQREDFHTRHGHRSTGSAIACGRNDPLSNEKCILLRHEIHQEYAPLLLL